MKAIAHRGTEQDVLDLGETRDEKLKACIVARQNTIIILEEIVQNLNSNELTTNGINLGGSIAGVVSAALVGAAWFCTGPVGITVGGAGAILGLIGGSANVAAEYFANNFSSKQLKEATEQINNDLKTSEEFISAEDKFEAALNALKRQAAAKNMDISTLLKGYLTTEKGMKARPFASKAIKYGMLGLPAAKDMANIASRKMAQKLISKFGAVLLFIDLYLDGNNIYTSSKGIFLGGGGAESPLGKEITEYINILQSSLVKMEKIDI